MPRLTLPNGHSELPIGQGLSQLNPEIPHSLSKLPLHPPDGRSPQERPFRKGLLAADKRYTISSKQTQWKSNCL